MLVFPSYTNVQTQNSFTFSALMGYGFGTSANISLSNHQILQPYNYRFGFRFGYKFEMNVYTDADATLLLMLSL